MTCPPSSRDEKPKTASSAPTLTCRNARLARSFLSHPPQNPLSYTLEAPSDFPLPTRIHALATGVHAILDHLP
jgi:hypothetical protein